MEQQISIKQLNKLEEDCRRMRSEVVLETVVAYFRRIEKTITSLFVEGRKTYTSLGNKGVPIR